MKKYLLLILAASFCLSGCKDDRKPERIDITGIWNIIDVEHTTKSANIGNQTVDIYIEFKSGNTFGLYQKLGAGPYRRFTGSWSLDGSMLSGKYSDNSSWGTMYDVQLEADILVLSSPGEIYTYKRTDALPKDVR